MTTIRAHIQTKCTTRGLGTKDMNHTRADKRITLHAAMFKMNELGREPMVATSRISVEGAYKSTKF